MLLLTFKVEYLTGGVSHSGSKTAIEAILLFNEIVSVFPPRVEH